MNAEKLQSESVHQATIEEEKRFVVMLRVPSFIDLTPESIRGDRPLPKKTADYQKAIAVMKAAGARLTRS